MENLTIGAILIARAGDVSGSASAEEVTAAGNVFTQTLKGLVPAPGTFNGYFLADNGEWRAVFDPSSGHSVLSFDGDDIAQLNWNGDIDVLNILDHTGDGTLGKIRADGSLLTNTPPADRLTKDSVDRVIADTASVVVRNSDNSADLLRLEDSVITGFADIIPSVDNMFSLGSLYNKWTDVFSYQLHAQQGHLNEIESWSGGAIYIGALGSSGVSIGKGSGGNLAFFGATLTTQPTGVNDLPTVIAAGITLGLWTA